MKTATSKTGEAPCGSSQSGFTLFEVLIVLAIVALVVSAVFLVPKAGSGTANLKSTAFSTAALLRQARSRAIVRGQEVSVLVDLSRRVIRSGRGIKPIQISKGIKVAMSGAANERKSNRIAGIRFYPNGSSTGGKLRFSRNEQTIGIQINWLTGRISIGDRRK